jgi:2,4'-dihydroxyacetophenone dioxygenase
MMDDVLKSMEYLIASPKEDNWVTLEKAGGMRVNTLWEDKETGASVALLDVPKGAGIPVRHRHASNQMMYCLKGSYEYLEPKSLILNEGSFYRNPKGHYHGPTRALSDCLLLEVYDGPHYAELPPYHTAETVGKIAPIDGEHKS